MMQTLGGLSPVILVVLAILVVFSLVSWTILVFKIGQIRVGKRGIQTFSDWFWQTRELEQIDAHLGRFGDTPLAAVFREGYREMKRVRAGEGSTIEDLSRSLRKAATQQIEKFESGASFLATTASTTPFIGLFGTVWGIMNAFGQIGEAGSTSLAIVAPGVSEALITTAVGLAVAIPAVVGYNYLQGQIRKLTSEIDNFSYDFLNLLQRALTASQ